MKNQEKNPIQVIIVDDHQIFIDGIISLFEEEKDIRIDGFASAEKDLYNLLEYKRADIILLDLNLGEEDGMLMIPRIRRRFPDIKIIVISMYNDTSLIKRSFELGASGYVLKSVGKNELISAIENVTKDGLFVGENVFIEKDYSPINTKIVSRNYPDDFQKKYNLTKRETDVLLLLAQSLSTKEIAEQLNISEMTVSTHRKRIKTKLGLKNVASMVKFAFDNQLF